MNSRSSFWNESTLTLLLICIFLINESLMWFWFKLNANFSKSFSYFPIHIREREYTLCLNAIKWEKRLKILCIFIKKYFHYYSIWYSIQCLIFCIEFLLLSIIIVQNIVIEWVKSEMHIILKASDLKHP